MLKSIIFDKTFNLLQWPLKLDPKNCKNNKKPKNNNYLLSAANWPSCSSVDHLGNWDRCLELTLSNKTHLLIDLPWTLDILLREHVWSFDIFFTKILNMQSLVQFKNYNYLQYYSLGGDTSSDKLFKVEIFLWRIF